MTRLLPLCLTLVKLYSTLQVLRGIRWSTPRSTKYSPYELVFTFKPRILPTIDEEDDDDFLDDPLGGTADFSEEQFDKRKSAQVNVFKCKCKCKRKVGAERSQTSSRLSGENMVTHRCLTPGFEPGTFRLLARHSNNCATHASLGSSIQKKGTAVCKLRASTLQDLDVKAAFHQQGAFSLSTKVISQIFNNYSALSTEQSEHHPPPSPNKSHDHKPTGAR